METFCKIKLKANFAIYKNYPKTNLHHAYFVFDRNLGYNILLL